MTPSLTVVLQECIHEFVYSEKAYVEDVKTLKHVFVDQMHTQKLLEHESWFPAWREAVNKLVAEGEGKKSEGEKEEKKEKKRESRRYICELKATVTA